MEKAVHVKAKAQWKKVEFDPSFLSAKGFDGLISFEELDDYDIIGSEKQNKPKQKEKLTANEEKSRTIGEESTASNTDGKTKKDSKKRKRKKKKKKADVVIEDLNKTLENESVQNEGSQKKKKRKKKRAKDDTDASPKKKRKTEVTDSEETNNKEETTEPMEDKDLKTTGMENWVPLMVPEQILRSLKEQGFKEPTPIQAQVLPSAIRNHIDIVGAAETKPKQKEKQTANEENSRTIGEESTASNTDGKTKKASKKRKRKKKKKKADVVIEDLNKTLENDSVQNEGSQKKKKRKKKRAKDGTDASPKKKRKTEVTDSEETNNKEETTEPMEEKDFKTTGMENWVPLMVPAQILRSLKEQGFKEPTPIQAQVLPSAIRDHMDIVGAAETGSGKTLAFGIPVLHFILRQRERQAQKDLDAEEDSGVEIGNLEAVNSDASEEEDDALNELVEVIEDNEYSSDDEDVTNNDDDENNDDDDDELVHEADDNVESGSDDDLDQHSSEGDENEIDRNEDDSSEEEIGELGDDGLGCVKVIKDADFSWFEVPPPSVPFKTGKTHPLALILEPTRELAIQVKNHLMAAAKYTDIKIATIVGGMSVQKQERILKRCPDIVIATPGRLWELVQKGQTYLSELEKTQHLVVDEADRMIEKGHFEELTKLLESMNKDAKLREKRHTYVFSATLTLIHSGPQRSMKKKKKIKLDEKQKLELLVQNIGLKAKPKIVDLTRKVGTVETLTEARINCAKDEKDIYLYYFLKQYPGRTLVFTNSKDCIRRLISIFTLLQCNPFPLHADMHQRQRLKNLDRFRDKSQSLLIASDVAARGLDIPNVQHVIHYQVPHTVENYVHRSGRTARASKEGLSVVLVGPEDLKNYRKIIHTLNKSEELPLFPIDTEFMNEAEKRVKMVRIIETQEYRFNKTKRQNDWFQKAAEDAGIEIDENDRLLNDLGDDVEQNRHRAHIKRMKTELSMILKQPLLPRGAGSRYPTQSGQLIQLTRKEEDKDAILNVKKDKKTQLKMIEKEKKRPLPVKKKKDKWKKKQRHKKNKPKDE